MARCPECGESGGHKNGCDFKPVYLGGGTVDHMPWPKSEGGWPSDRRTMTRQDDELVYAAYDRCQCGAGLAYPKGIGINGYWECSDILTGRAVPKGQPGSVPHSQQYPFAFWEIKSEQQPSANGATTRPNKTH